MFSHLSPNSLQIEALFHDGLSVKPWGFKKYCDFMEKESVWVPVTPGKPVLTFAEGIEKENINEKLPCSDYFDMMQYMEKSGINETYELAASILGEHETVLGEARKASKSSASVQYDTSSIEDEAVNVPPLECEDDKARGVDDSHAGYGSVPTPSRTTESRKRRNDGIDMNKKSKQRPRVKKHRPKVVDDSKPKKVPKAQTSQVSTPRPKTPKPATPNRVQERKKSRKNKFPGSTSYSHGDVVQDAQTASRASKVSVKSCKRSLDFDYHLVDGDSHPVSKLQEETPRRDFNFEESDFIGKIVTSKRNTPRRNKYQNKSIKASDDLLVNNYRQQHGQNISVIRYQEQVDKNGRRYVYFYQRRKKISSATTCHIPTLQVYQRSYRKNQCVQNSKKCGPTFPKMFKKKRMLRKKAIEVKWWDCKPVKVGKIHVRRSHNKDEQTTREKVQNKVNKSKDKKRVVKSVFHTKEWDFRLFSSPPRRQRSIMPTRPNFKRILNNTEKYLICQEKNFLQIKKCLPLQEIPVHKIDTFTSEHWDFQKFNNSDGNVNSHQLHEVPVVANQSLLLTQEGNPLTKEDLNNLYAREYMRYLILKFENLDINSEFKQLVVRDKNISGPLVKINPKKRKMIPKVDLDQESLRVWKLLMENDGSEPVEETDKDKEEWWEKQRDIFRGRVDSFIAKMHLIQGDRRFSPWKGSVIDSVVGVYLTQNVSDHLSSSAFMSVVARFPAKPRSKEVDDHVDVVASQESVTSNTVIDGVFFINNEMEQYMMELANSKSKEVDNHVESVANQVSVSSYTLINGEFSKNIEMEQHMMELAKSKSKEVDDHVEVIANQETVTSYAPTDGGFSKNNEMKQDMNTSCGDVNDVTPIMELEQDSVLNPSLVQDKMCGNGNSDTFRKLLEVEEADYLKQFCKLDLNESPVNEKKVDGDVSTSKIEAKGQSVLSFDFPSCPEPCATLSDVNTHLFETSKSEFAGQQNSTHEEKPIFVAPIFSLHSEITTEQGADESMKEIPVETRSMRKKKNKIEKKRETKIDWEEFRKTYCKPGGKETNENNMDAVDWDAVRCATVKELADIISERGMNNVLAERIKDFLDRMYKDHGTLDLEWLRNVPPDKAKEFLLSIEGIGLKSVECVRLLTLHHLAFPVDTNVGRVATRLGWVPLQPLPDAVQIHLLNAYPMVDTIQKYLFPRLCTLDQRTLYELHYQLITFGKVFCTKVKPNCNACPMRGECRHYASAFASNRLALPGSKECSNVTSIIPAANEQNHSISDTQPSSIDVEVNHLGSSYHGQTCEPIIEVPPSPEPEVEEKLPTIGDIEDLFCESDDEIPTIRLNTEEFKETLKDTIDANNINLPEADTSKALVALSAEAASFRVPQMKYVARLRTMHLVYELPDSHPSLAGFDKREHDDPSPYLIRIWLPGEIPKSLDNTQNRACDSANDNQEETVKGTILIPCRTANRGTFPLNGTYFQVNEVFADDETSHVPMDIPRSLLWNLPRRELGCGSSATSIFRALSTAAIQRLFWRGSICVRGFNRKTRQPRPLNHRFHISTTAVAAENKKLGKR